MHRWREEGRFCPCVCVCVCVWGTVLFCPVTTKNTLSEIEDICFKGHFGEGDRGGGVGGGEVL